LSIKEAAQKKREQVTQEVVIDGETYTVRKITDSTTLLNIQQEIKAQSGRSFEIEGKQVELNDLEIGPLLYLREALVDEEATLKDLILLSRHCGAECMEAGLTVMEMTGIMPENQEKTIPIEAKND
jgi:hypothetical protein